VGFGKRRGGIDAIGVALTALIGLALGTALAVRMLGGAHRRCG